VLEHITTSHAVTFVEEAPSTLAATITPHHLWFNRNALFVNGLKPHHYCLPVLKRRQHQEALIKAAISGDPKFFIGTDSAPHLQSQKESACGCAGIFNAHAAIEFYAQIFESYNALDKLEGFTSKFGPSFYGLPFNKEKLTLRKREWTIPSQIPFGQETLTPFLAGEPLQWQTLHNPWCI
jgi:dihydroorotase